MTQGVGRWGFLFTSAVAIVLGGTALGQSARDTIRPGSSAIPVQKSTRPAGKGVLPDPALLDGAKHPPEKRPEQGMLGEFEMPGDENARTGRAGGQPQQQQSQGGEQQQQDKQGGGGQTAQAGQQQQQSGGGGTEADQQDGAQASGQPGGGEGDPNAKAEGIQVAQLQGEGGGEPGDMTSGARPSPVSIGDAAMQIKTMPNSPSIVGATQSSGQTQQHEKTTGTGGAPPTGNNANRGAEKGRTMPAGL
ncbi:MAG: hypothetical protein WD941_00235 [Opitutus sp.]